MDVLLIPLAMFYLLRDWPLLLAHIEQLIPRRRLAKVQEIAKEVDSVLAEFLRGQMAIMLVWAVFGTGQLLEGMVVTPWQVGDRIGLHPLAVVFALLACGQLFGFFGVLLALPLSAVLLVALRHSKAWYLSGDLYRN